MRGGLLRNAELVAGREVALAAEPIFHFDVELIEGHAVADFEDAVGDGKGVVEDGVVGEVAHREVVDPLDGAWIRYAGGVDALDSKFAGKHLLMRLRRRAGTWVNRAILSG